MSFDALNFSLTGHLIKCQNSTCGNKKQIPVKTIKDVFKAVTVIPSFVD
jgi:hypothetical protein